MKRIVSVLIILMSSLIVEAQETTSEIVGTVSGGKKPLVGVTITVVNLPTGTQSATTTRQSGRYNLPNLKVGGPYLITVSYVGYETAKRDSVYLLLGQEFKADFDLNASAASLEGVTVTSVRQNGIINSSRTGSQEIINRTQIERLPTINRSLQDFTKLEPTSNGLNFGGRSSQYNNLTVDGANFNNSFGLSGILGGQTNSQPISIEAIEQIQVNVAPYDVRQGGFSGAGVNSVTRSGTNKFRGSVYYYTKNENTQGYNVGYLKAPKTPLTYHIDGFTIGGPLIKNKLFFFLSAEQVRQELPATSYTASDANHPAVSGSVSKANADSLNALSALLKSSFGYDPGAYQNYNFLTRSDKITAKLDWNIGQKNTFTIKYNYLKSYADQFPSGSRPNNGTSLVTSGSGSPNNTGLPFFSAGYGINNNFNIFIAELNTRFSSTLSNKFQVGYTALRDFRSQHSPSATMPFVDILDGAGSIFTSFGYEMYTYNNLLSTDVYQISDIATLYKGKHEITFGTQDYYRKYKNAFAPGYQGVYQFNSLNDFRNSVLNGAANSRNYYLQYSALPGGEFPFAYAGSTELGVFAQDKYRPTKNLTLTYGLRLDMTIYKQAFTDNPYFDALKFKDGNSYNIGKAPGNALIFSPRIGFNWDAFGNRSLQIRGGAGIFSGPPPFVWISNQASNNGIQFGALQTIGTSVVANGPVTNGTGVAFNVNPDKLRPTTANANTSYSVALTDKNFKYPTVLKSSLAIDKKFANDWVVTVEGTYSKDINAVYYQNLNLKETTGFPLSGADNRRRFIAINGSAYDLYASNKYYFNKPTASNYANNTLADPALGTAILMSNSNKGYSYTITGRIQKTFRNLYASVAYTYSESKNVAEGGSTASSLWSARAVSNTDPNGDNLGYASYYQPHRVIAFASYRVAYAKHFATSIGAIFEASPGGSSSYIYSGDLNGDGNTNDLVYIPRNASEINLVQAGSGGSGVYAANFTGTKDLRTPAQLWQQLDNYINQDKYLSAHRGEYAKANAFVYPFYKRLDLNLTQDIYVNTGKDRHTLRLTVDLINAGNLLNKYWGSLKTPTLTSNASGYQLLTYEGQTVDNKPSFSFPYQDATNLVPRTTNFTNSTGIASRWQMQFGVKYIFN